MMENINNIPFSFDRNVSKWVAKLGTSHADNSFADGITLTNTVINNYPQGEDDAVVDNLSYKFTYKTKSGDYKTDIRTVSKTGGFIGVLGLANRVVPDSNLFYTVDFELERDPWKNYKNFYIDKIEEINIATEYPDAAFQISSDDSHPVTYPVYGLYFKKASDDPTEGLVYYYNQPIEDYAVYCDAGRTNRVNIGKADIEPEVLMTELYYRNSAGHAYADYDINKVKYTVTKGGALQYATDGDTQQENINKPLDPSALYTIGFVAEYVAKNHFKSDSLPSGTNPNSVTPADNTWAKALLKGDGGPFDYETVVYLGTKEHPWICSGNLGDLIYYGGHHAPFNQHFLYGKQIEKVVESRIEIEDLPIFKDINGRRPMLPRDEQLNPDKIVTLLNIRAKVNIIDMYNPQTNLSDTYYNMKASYTNGSGLISAAQYESVVGITTKWNMQFLTSDFWKHGQAGLIDIADDIYPTYWYGKQHPFEFECVVVDDPSLHKIFTNLELVANKAKPESFHYEVVGEAYDFAKDKVNMYFRQEALKALWQYNGADITYDRNFLRVQPRQVARSADLVHRYFTRQDTINDIEDYYIHVTYPQGYDYRHLSGAEIVYYPTRQEFRVWNHAMAVDLKDLSQDDARSIIAGNCEYLEDRWKVTINPILVCYKNEYKKYTQDDYPLIHPSHSTWAKAYGSDQLLPPLPIVNSPVPTQVKESGQITFPGISINPTNGEISETNLDRSNALYHLYDLSKFGINGNYAPLDTASWLSDPSIYRYQFGADHNRKETDVRDKFIKIRIRYSGEELAIIDFLNTIYQVSYA